MKKVTLIGMIILLISGTFYLLQARTSSSSPQTVPPEPLPLSSEPQLQDTPDMAKPKKILISALGIEGYIEEVGLEANGDMATPRNNVNLGWYSDSAIPGNAGRAVLAAHTGLPEVPTVFRKFETLKQGDAFQITDVADRIAEFEIIESAVYTPETAPRHLIFGPSSTARLALITCTGTWLPAQKTYSHRLVLYAVRKS